MFLAQSVLKTCNNFTGEYQCGIVILIKLLYNFIKIRLLNDCSPVNLLHISQTLFYKNTYEGLQGLFCDSNKGFQARNKEFCRAGEFSWNKGTLIGIHLQHEKKSPAATKSLSFLSRNSQKFHFK